VGGEGACPPTLNPPGRRLYSGDAYTTVSLPSNPSRATLI